FAKRWDTVAERPATRGCPDPAVVQRQGHIEDLDLEGVARLDALDVHWTGHGREDLQCLRRGAGALIRGETVIRLHDERLPRLDPEDGRMRSTKAGTELVPGHSLHHQAPPRNSAFRPGVGYTARLSVAMPPEDVNATSGQSCRGA